MKMQHPYPRFRAAAVQAAPAFLNRNAAIAKVEAWVARARDKGADLVVFGESYIPAFPLWNMLYAPVDQHQFYRRLFDRGVDLQNCFVENSPFAAPSALEVVAKLNVLTARYRAAGSTIICIIRPSAEKW